MPVRLATEADFESIKRLHKRSGYGYQLPDSEHLRGLHIISEGSDVIAAAGFERCAQVYMVLDTTLPAGIRMEAIKALHIPVARAVEQDESERAFVFLDPQFPRFGKRLMNLGWSKKLWNCFEIDQATIKEKLSKC